MDQLSGFYQAALQFLASCPNPTNEALSEYLPFTNISPTVRRVHIPYFVENRHIIHGSFEINVARIKVVIVFRDSLNQITRDSDVVREFRLLRQLIFARPDLGLTSFDWMSCEVLVRDCTEQTNSYDYGNYALNSIFRSIGLVHFDISNGEHFSKFARYNALVNICDML